MSDAGADSFRRVGRAGPDETHTTRRVVVTDPTAAVDELLRENAVLSDALAELQGRMPDDEDLAFLHNLRIERERASWAWKMLRTYVPWITAVCGSFGTLAYWLLQNFQVRSH